MLNKFQKSLTLIELLVVIAIVGLIAAIIMVGVSGTQAKARDAKRQAELDQIRKALQFYYISKGQYPITTDWISLEEDDGTNGPFSQAMKPDYLSTIPRDPLYPQEYESGKKYSYQYQATTTESYEAYAKREQGGFFKISSEPGTIAYLPEGPEAPPPPPPPPPPPVLSCSITSGSCANTTVLKISATTNAHAELPDQDNYTYYVCCSGNTLGISCSGNYDTFLKLSGLTNAHVEKKTQSNYANFACLSMTNGDSTITCDYATDCSSLGELYTCLASISGETNAHIGDCNAYPAKVCCAIALP